MLIYISAPFEEQATAQELRDVLFASGYGVRARWLDEPAMPYDTMPDDYRMGLPIRDLDDIDDCDVLVLINPESYRRSGTGGRHVETGYALRAGKPIFLLGARTNVFHDLPMVDSAPEGDDEETALLAWLDSICVRLLTAF